MKRKPRLSNNMYQVIDERCDSTIAKLCNKLKNISLKHIEELKQIQKIKNNKFKYDYYDKGCRIRITNEDCKDCFGGNKSALPIGEYESEVYDGYNLFEALCEEAYSSIQDIFNVHEPYDGFYDDENYILMNIHCVNAGDSIVDIDPEVKKQNDFMAHIDYRALIIYLDVDCDEAVLDIYDDYGEVVMKTIPLKVDKNNNNIRCVMLHGNCYHKHRPISNGTLFAVSFRFQRDVDADEEEEDEEDEQEDENKTILPSPPNKYGTDINKDINEDKCSLFNPFNLFRKSKND